MNIYLIKLLNFDRYLCTDVEPEYDHKRCTDYYFMSPNEFMGADSVWDRLVIFGSMEQAIAYMNKESVKTEAIRVIDSTEMEVVTFINVNKAIEDEILS